jgi:hypothetical protein
MFVTLKQLKKDLNFLNLKSGKNKFGYKDVPKKKPLYNPVPKKKPWYKTWKGIGSLAVGTIVTIGGAFYIIRKYNNQTIAEPVSSQVPGPVSLQVPEQGVPQVPEQGVPQVPGPVSLQVPEQGVPQVPEQEYFVEGYVLKRENGNIYVLCYNELDKDSGVLKFIKVPYGKISINADEGTTLDKIFKSSLKCKNKIDLDWKFLNQDENRRSFYTTDKINCTFDDLVNNDNTWMKNIPDTQNINNLYAWVNIQEAIKYDFETNKLKTWGRESFSNEFIMNLKKILQNV